jgi:hypothetical protein
MKKGSTLFLKSVIYLIGLLVLGLCIILIGVMVGGKPGTYVPMMLVMLAAAVPFFYALRQGVLLLNYIEKDAAFSENSLKAIRTIKHCAFVISALYAAGIPLIIYAAETDDAPGVVLLGLVFIFAPLVTGVFAAVLERLFSAAIAIKSENELTV